MHRLSLSGREAPRPFATTKAFAGSSSLIHSFNNYAMGTIAGPFRRAPAPVPEHPPSAARRGQALGPAFLRIPRTLTSASLRGALRSGNPDPSRRPGAAPERPRPPPCQPWVSGLRPDSPRQTCRVRGATERASMETPRPRVQRPSARATPGPGGLGGWVGTTGHSPPSGQIRGACSKPFETA